jgi:hypothetical protein
MRWFKEITGILNNEPETWLTYLHGQQLHNRPMLTREKPRYRGLFLQVAKFGALLLRDFRLKQLPELERRAKFLVFAGTANQMGSLDKTIRSLKDRGEELISICDPQLLTGRDRVKGNIPYQLSITDVVRSVILFTYRGFGLYRALKIAHPVSVGWHFANFCRVYIYLAYFYRVLSQVKPEFVITANDHNVPNRCMLAVAHHQGIKTVYLQHASVSSIFPALRLNYAFLDGQSALDTYRECERNQPNTARDVPIPQVILSGQKKYLKRSNRPNKNVVGVALNALDNAEAGIELINALVENGQAVRLRWHPGQARRDIGQYRGAFANSERVELSDPREEFVSNFMEEIGWLIAGNSSIHLEAALAGVIPIYYEFEPADQPDYYGYVKHGLSEPASSVGEVLELIENTRDNHSPSAEAVRYYSSTYLTEWESREGELVAECLQRLSVGEALPVEVAEFYHTSKPVECLLQGQFLKGISPDCS